MAQMSTQQRRADAKDDLEALVDVTSVTYVLTALANICSFKAEQLEMNWQDSASAQEWDKAAKAIEAARAKVARLAISQKIG